MLFKNNLAILSWGVFLGDKLGNLSGNNQECDLFHKGKVLVIIFLNPILGWLIGKEDN